MKCFMSLCFSALEDRKFLESNGLPSISIKKLSLLNILLLKEPKSISKIPEKRFPVLENIQHIDGTPYYPDYPTKSFHKIINSIPELPQKIKLHGLRTSCVSILVHEGMDVKSIQKWVGHKDINTTLKIYAKVKEKEAKQQISNAMTNVLPLKKYDNK